MKTEEIIIISKVNDKIRELEIDLEFALANGDIKEGARITANIVKTKLELNRILSLRKEIGK